jgi:hypothetical protein
MPAKIRRLLLVLAGSAGIVAATSLTAQAGLTLPNHCQDRLSRRVRGEGQE